MTKMDEMDKNGYKKGFLATPQKSHLEQSEKENKKWKTGHFWSNLHLQENFLAILAIFGAISGYFLKKP